MKHQGLVFLHTDASLILFNHYITTYFKVIIAKSLNLSLKSSETCINTGDRGG